MFDYSFTVEGRKPTETTLYLYLNFTYFCKYIYIYTRIYL